MDSDDSDDESKASDSGRKSSEGSRKTSDDTGRPPLAHMVSTSSESSVPPTIRRIRPTKERKATGRRDPRQKRHSPRQSPRTSPRTSPVSSPRGVRRKLKVGQRERVDPIE